MNMKIVSTGSALGDQVLTNKDLEKMVETSDEWIRERTGIGSRHVAKNDTVASLAAKACRKALEGANKKPEDIDMILLATCSPEKLLPCCACQVQAELGAVNAVAFDLNAACSGFLFALEIANAHISSGIYKNSLVIGSEVLSKLVDYNDRSTCILFGDGAGAVYVEASEDMNTGFLGMMQRSDGSKGEVLACDCRIKEQDPNSFITMDGREVYKFATRQVPICIEAALENAKLSVEDIDLFVLHQANIRIIESISKRLKVDMSKFPVNLDRVGNMSSAAIPVMLDELNQTGKLIRGQKLVLSGFGAGLTYGACVVQW